MFRSHKQLIQTPEERRGPRRAEFTPIGTHLNGNGASLNVSAATRTRAEPDTGSPVSSSFMNQSGDMSTFSSLEKTPGSTKIYRGSDIFPGSSDEEEDYHDRRRGGNLVTGAGASMLVKKQATQAKQLQTDNLNLRVELMSLKKSLQGLPQDKKLLIEENIQLNRQVLELQAALANVQGDLATERRQQSENATGNIQEMQRAREAEKAQDAKIREYENRLADMKEDLAAAQHDREASEKAQQDMEDEVSSLKLEVGELKRELQSRPADTGEKDDQIMELQTELNAAEAEADKLRTENDQLSDRMKDLELDAEKSRNERAEMTEREPQVAPIAPVETESPLLGQLQSSKGANDKLRQRIRDDSNKMAELKQQVGSLDKHTNRLEKENEALRRQVKALGSGNTKATEMLKGEIESVYGKANQYQGESAKLREQVRDLQVQVREAERKVRDSERQVRDSEMQMRESERRQDEVRMREPEQRSNANSTSLSDETQQYIKDLELDKRDLYDSLVGLNGKYKELEEQLEAQQSALAAKQKELDELADKSGGRDRQLMEENSKLHEQLIQEADKYRARAQALEAEYSKREDQVADDVTRLKSENEDLREDNIALQRELDRFGDGVDPEEYGRLQSDFVKVSSEYKEVSEKLRVQEEKYASLQQSSEALVDRLRDNERDVEELQRTLDSNYYSKSSESAELERKLRKAEEEHASVSRDLSRVTAEKEHLAESNKLLTESRDRLQKRVETVETEQVQSNTSVALKLQEALSKSANLQASLTKKEIEGERLSDELASVSKEKQRLKSILDKIEKTQRDAISKNDLLSEDLKAVRSVHETTDSERKELRAKLAEKTEYNKKLVADYNSMKNELLNRIEQASQQRKKLEQEMRRLEQQAGDATREKSQLKVRITSLQQQVSQLKQREDQLKAKEQVMLEEQARLQHERDQEHEQREELESRRLQYPPTPKTPSHNSAPSPDLIARNTELETSRQLSIIRLQKYKDQSTDFRFLSGYLRKQLDSRDEVIEKNIALLQATAGVSFDTVTPLRDTPSLAGAFLAVRAAVRFKRRLEDMKRTKNRERQLKHTLVKLQRKLYGSP